MNRAEEILLKEMRYIASISNGQVKRVADSALASVSEYLATEPKPTIKEALAQQGIKLRTEFEPKQRDHIEDMRNMVGERAELIERLAKQWAELDPADPYRADIGQAVSMLEADAQQAKRVPMTDGGIAEISERMEASDPTDSFWREFARAIEAHHGIPPADKPTGWDNGLSQDYCAEFGQWLASRPGARQQVKQMFDMESK